ncbi:MAG TPA: pirin family protein [Casimicrobiaceae bacterium]|nr:pirin family protein [Casimicrobiaceae bacterium]
MPVTLSLLRPHIRDLGGFAVRRVLPSSTHRTVGPFIFFDHFGPVDFPPGEGIDVRPHPHIGLATVTYLFAGAILHRDSLGSVQKIVPGDVNWMTAGRGIVHSERSTPEDRASGMRMHGLQTWVVLPKALEETAPGFTHVPGAQLPHFDVDGVRVTVVAGHAFGRRAPTPTHSETLYAALEMPAGTTLTVPFEHEQRAVYAVEGDVEVDGASVTDAHMAVVEADVPFAVRARSDAKVMLVGGARPDGERFIWWNFVSSSRERLDAAKATWQAQGFGQVPGETEFIPLPDR